MSKIERSDSNLFDMPKGSFIRNKSYVYVNTTNKYVSPDQKREKGTRGYTGHDSVCIGVLANPADPKCRKFYANENYRSKLNNTKVELPNPPKYADSLSVGLNSWLAVAADDSGLSKDLADVFGVEDARLILDLAHYMISAESAVMQHYPAWARDHVIFSDDIYNDTYLGSFLKNNLTISKISKFRETWADQNIGDGRIYLCYDSTNVNSQAEGVFIVQKGHAKDDPTLNQVNTDYVVRQEDGLPLTYLHSPGSVTDIAQAQEMIAFVSELKTRTGREIHLVLVCDRGYISEKNLRQMDDNKLGYVLMLRTTFGKYDELANEVIDSIKSYKYELHTEDGDEKYGVTRDCTLYEGGPTCKAQIIWSAEKYRNKRKEVAREIAAQRKKLDLFIAENNGKCLTQEELKWIPTYFSLKLQNGEPIREERRKRGRGTGTRIVETPTFIIRGYEDNEDAVNREIQKSGIIIIITSEDITAQETIDIYPKRDCVEKTFQALKSHLGMDKIGVTTEEAMHGKGLIWFVASILHALLFNQTNALRVSDKKNYTVLTMVEQLEAIKADLNLTSRKRQRRYKLTRRQLNILGCFGISEEDIDKRIAEITD